MASPENGGSSTATASNLKRKRSPSLTNVPPASTSASLTAGRAAKPSTQSLSINYLARSSSVDLPLVHKDETLPTLLQLLAEYTSVLDRQESLASNLGARPLGPILIKRFERCFDAPPKVVASHSSSKTTVSGADDQAQQVSWLDVIEFARSHPSQFTLSAFSEGRRVCQFYYPHKQVRVQISEEDYLFINSGRCQELIPPLPIWEDEEKEVSTCDVLESKLKELTNAADVVAARTRQLSHRLKGRKAAILERRAEGGSATPAKAISQHAPATAISQATSSTPVSDSPSFVAVNTSGLHTGANTMRSTASMRDELLQHFESLPQNQRHRSKQSAQPVLPQHVAPDNTATKWSHHALDGSVSPRSATTSSHDHASRPQLGSPRQSSSKHNFSRPLHANTESTQPFRPLCQANMDNAPRSQRVIPPCDRCRRLRMDCVKNLTSCAGCTKKHTRCHWKDVTREELDAIDQHLDPTTSLERRPSTEQANLSGSTGEESELDEHSDSVHDQDALPSGRDAQTRLDSSQQSKIQETSSLAIQDQALHNEGISSYTPNTIALSNDIDVHRSETLEGFRAATGALSSAPA